MSDVLAAHLMLIELLFLSPNFISFQDEDRLITFKILSSISHSSVCLVIVTN